MARMLLRHDPPWRWCLPANCIADRIAVPFDCRAHRIRIGATIGIAPGRLSTGVECSLKEAICAADQAM